MDAEEEDMRMDMEAKMEEIEQEIEYHEARVLVLRKELNGLLDDTAKPNEMLYT